MERRILTTHAGSLPRPAEITRLHVAGQSGTADTGAALAAIIAKQREVGIDIGNDGEQQREHFFLYLRRRLTGYGESWVRPGRADDKRYPSFIARRTAENATRPQVSTANNPPPVAVGEVRYVEPGAAVECASFTAALPAGVFTDAFMTAPSPGMLVCGMPNRFYPDDDAYLDALVTALAQEYRHIIDAGLILQIDAPDMAMEKAMLYQDRTDAEYLAYVEKSVAALNRALEGLPRERVRLHVCWGNQESPHDADFALEALVPALRKARVGGHVLPFANPRHAHEFKLLPKLLADDQIIVAGVIDTTTNYIEHPEVVADRLERVAAAVGDPARVQAGTDCGFDTGAGMGRVAEEIAWAKLAAMGAGARLASTRLF